MEPRIFNLKALFLGGLIAAAQLCYAQKASGSDDSTREYNKQMQQLQQQMQDLQKQMSKLQTEEFKKSAEILRKQAIEMSKQQSLETQKDVERFKLQSEELRKSALEMAAKARTFAYQFKNEPRVKIEGLPVIPNTPNLPEAPLAPKVFNYNFSYSDKDLQKQIQSGEVIEKVKNYSKSYSVDGNDKLQISNKFGKVVVNTWSKNEIKVDVQIKADANDADNAQKLLDGVSIIDSKQNSVVSFVTNINNSKNPNGNSFIGSWFSSGKSNVHKVEVNYIVYMPAKSQLQINNSLGSIQIVDPFSGKVVLNVNNGSLIAKTLSNIGNEVNVSYGSATIENYIGKELNVLYGSLKLDGADKLNATISKGSAKIGTITTSGNINMNMGGLQIANLSKNVKNLSVNSSYSSVKVGLADDESANFDVTVSYGSFNYGGRTVTLIKNSSDSDRRISLTKTYKGTMGKGNSDKLITIKSSYGSVKFD